MPARMLATTAPPIITPCARSRLSLFHPCSTCISLSVCVLVSPRDMFLPLYKKTMMSLIHIVRYDDHTLEQKIYAISSNIRPEEKNRRQQMKSSTAFCFQPSSCYYDESRHTTSSGSMPNARSFAARACARL